MGGDDGVDDAVGGGDAVEVAHQARGAQAGVVAGHHRVALVQPVRQVLVVAGGARQRRRGAVVAEPDRAVCPCDDGEAALGCRTGWQEHRAGADGGLIMLVDSRIQHAVGGPCPGQGQRRVQRHGLDGGPGWRDRPVVEAGVQAGPVQRGGLAQCRRYEQREQEHHYRQDL